MLFSTKNFLSPRLARENYSKSPCCSDRNRVFHSFFSQSPASKRYFPEVPDDISAGDLTVRRPAGARILGEAARPSNPGVTSSTCRD